MSLNQEVVQRAAEMICWADAREVFGEEGPSGLRTLLNGIREFFRMIPPDHMACRFVFIYRIEIDDRDDDQSRIEGAGSALSVEMLAGYRGRIEAASVILVVVGQDGRFWINTAPTLPSLEDLSRRSLVFVNEDGVDRFIIGGRAKEMGALATGAASNFAVATVSDLGEALERYRQDATEVSCPILENVWVGGRDGHRLVFQNKPESTMRRSLVRFLNIRIRGDVSVRPEHNTGETRPVDLVVDWFGSKLRALIEIKWLGQALTRDSDGTQFTSYGARRAHEGFQQLVDYVDREQATDPTAVLSGYLVVFDGRRRNVIDGATPIRSEDALYFRGRDIDLLRDYATERSNIAPLVRFFLEPRSSLFAPPTTSD